MSQSSAGEYLLSISYDYYLRCYYIDFEYWDTSEHDLIEVIEMSGSLGDELSVVLWI